MRMDGNWKRRPWRAGLLCALICLMCFFLPGTRILRPVPAFGMEISSETEAEAAENTPDIPCTIFLYLCGSNLESKYGLATQNIDEILAADIPESTTVVIQTGGSLRWWSSEWIEDDRLQRYVVRDHHLELVMEMDNASMGSADTFCDFLGWGCENYFADRNILVMWDHGGSSADGICYDENFGYDCLDRSELMEAFDQAGLPGRLDLICLDTCYMGELVNAFLFSDYARYMTASQTIVPGPGMDYRTLAEGAGSFDLEEFGKVLCDTFMVKCAQTGREEEAQLAFYDLDAADGLIEELDQGAVTLEKAYKKTGAAYELFTGAQKARVSNSGSKSNVIDLMQFVNALSYLDWSHQREKIRSYLDEMLLYQVCGDSADLNGVSIFYPLSYNEAQLEEYEQISPARNYCELLQEIYADLPDDTIAFRDPGSIGEEGSFDIELAEESRPYLRNVILRVWKESEFVPDTYMLLGDSEVDTYVTELGRKLSDLRMSSALSGEAYALDGHLLLLSVSSRMRTQTYSAPVRVNGEDTIYTFVVKKSLFKRYRRVIYAMLGGFFDEDGLPVRAVGHLRSGDKVCVYEAMDESGKNLTAQEAFTIGEDDPRPELIPLPEGKYRCQYLVTDIIGRTAGSDYCLFEITEEDGTRTVKPTEIS